MPRSEVGESRLWAWLSKDCKKYGQNLHIGRLENLLSAGMPDVEGCLLGVQFWIELKTCRLPARESTLIKPKFEPLQVPWIEKRVQAGGNVYVLLQLGSGHDAERYLIPGSYASELENGVSRDRLYDLSLISPSTKTGIFVILTAVGKA